MTILHILCVVYLVVAALTICQMLGSSHGKARGPHVLLVALLPIVIAIYALTLHGSGS